MGKLYHMTDVDAGLALCHMAVASEHEGIPFRFNVNKKECACAAEEFYLH